MHLNHPRRDRRGELRRQIARLEGLPLRPTTARAILTALPDLAAESCCVSGESPELEHVLETDPGWVLARWLGPEPGDPLELIADRPWWPSLPVTAAGAVQRFWRHAVAVSCAARRLAVEAGDPDPDAVARIGLVHNLGYWALAVVAPERLATLLAVPEAAERRYEERELLGIDACDLGRSLAERWGAGSALAETAWLHASRDHGLNDCAEDPLRLDLIQRAYGLAEQTPWAMFPPELGDSSPTDASSRLLMAEVQARCGSGFVEAVSASEERLARSNVRLRKQISGLLREHAARARLIDALACTEPAEGPDAWAERASQAWTAEPGVTQARVAWLDQGSDGNVPDPCPNEQAAPEPDKRPPDQILELGLEQRPVAAIQLWTDPEAPATDWDQHPTREAWGGWAAQIREQDRLERRLESVIEAFRRRVENEESARSAARLDALAEFAAGASHELNNPLAVILGRAQLLLSRRREPELVRSLRAIITQAQRANRILRDLMYVARPPEPRPRPCQPDEIVRACLRDLQEEAQARGITLTAEVTKPAPVVWADPDHLRHLADTLARNALEATPSGGTVLVSTNGGAGQLAWTFQDNGRGLSPAEVERLFDPFYCGRQAGRGLGLGLPRAARFVAQVGGRIRCRSWPGRGTVFQLTMPVVARATAEASNGKMAAQEPRPETPR